MTEDFIRELAARHGLTMLKRITAGQPSTGHFAAFELAGPESGLVRAWVEVGTKSNEEKRGHGFDTMQVVTNKGHAEYGKPFIQIQSVWCQPEA